MSTVSLTEGLRAEYQRLFNTCVIRPEREADVDRWVARIQENRPRYDSVSAATNVPWFFIAFVHCMEASLSFDCHLHNGDPLGAPTVRVPAGRPLGSGPFTWESSAEDVLRLKRLHKWTDWTLPALLYKLEAYNGFGYRRQDPKINTPYLWSFSNHYSKGKYVRDGKFSPTAVSKQCGSAVLLRRLAETGAVRL
jgi:lysozyme family protein